MQIGPRIRVGGTLGKIGQEVKLGVGKVAKAAAPVASFINPALGAALAAGGTILDTSKGKVNPFDIVKNTAMAYGPGKLLGSAGSIASKIPGISRLADIPGVSKIGSLAGKVGGFVDKLDDFPGGEQISGALRGVRDQVVGGVKGSLSGGLGGNLGNTLLAGAGGISAINAQNRANDLEKRALDSATSAYDERAPLRSMGLSMMQDQQAPSLPFAGNNAGNPYAAMHGGAAPQAAPQAGGFSPAAPVAPPAIQKRLNIRRAA